MSEDIKKGINRDLKRTNKEKWITINLMIDAIRDYGNLNKIKLDDETFNMLVDKLEEQKLEIDDKMMKGEIK